MTGSCEKRGTDREEWPGDQNIPLFCSCKLEKMASAEETHYTNSC